MNTKTKLLLLITLPAFVCGYGQNSSSAQAPPEACCRPAGVAQITGVWRGQMNDLPAVTLTITDEAGALSGAIPFYLHQRKTVNDPYSSTPGIPEPLLNPTFDGQTLTFQVSHRRAHPPGTLSNLPVTFHLKLIETARAELINASGHSPAFRWSNPNTSDLEAR